MDETLTGAPGEPLSYRDAGVDIEAGALAVEMMKAAVRRTYGPQVLWGIGAFGGLYDASALAGMEAPVLVASTDGVGTKTRVAAALGRYDTVGVDIVNHCINDILVQGAQPLFFLDYIAMAKLDPAVAATLVGGYAAACREAGCALLGGETAEMPGVYAPGEFDLAGTIVGVVEKARIVDGSAIRAGDAVIGLASTGLHTNGYSLARRVLAGRDLGAELEPGITLGQALLAPHRSYLGHAHRLWAAGIGIRGMAHITGGGLIDNPPRIIPPGLSLHLRRDGWPLPAIFRFLQREGRIDEGEMAHVFNLGLGMLVMVPPEQAGAALQALGDGAWRVGEIVPAGEARVRIL